jgi:hypothetical protein
MGLRSAIDSGYVAALNARDRAKKVARIGLVGTCIAVAYRRGNDLPPVEDGKDGEYIKWRPALPTEAADSAVEHGKALAKRLAEVANLVWKG